MIFCLLLLGYVILVIVVATKLRPAEPPRKRIKIRKGAKHAIRR